MDSTSISDIVERLEKLEIHSQSSSISRKLQSGPYDPPPVPVTISTSIAEICNTPEGVSEEQYHQNSKLSHCEMPKFDGNDFEYFVERFARFLRLSE